MAHVALLAEGVDRNIAFACAVAIMRVALLAEGVDRNHFPHEIFKIVPEVALLAEGVDRNNFLLNVDWFGLLSPSSRRAWIEIKIASLKPV